MAFIRNAQNFTAAQADVTTTISKAFRYDEEYSHSNVHKNKITATHTSSNYRTKPCLKGENCTYFDEKTGEDKCQFANDPSKLVALKCMYNERCRNEHCKRLHTGQTMEEYISINQFTWPEKIEKIEKVKEEAPDMSDIDAKYNSSSFIIRIEESDEEDEDAAIDRVCEVGNAEHYKIVNEIPSQPPSTDKVEKVNDKVEKVNEDMMIESDQSMMKEEQAIQTTRVRAVSQELSSVFSSDSVHKTSLWLMCPRDIIASRAREAILEIEQETLREISDEIEEACDEIEIIQHQKEFMKECEDRDSDPEFEEYVDRMEAFTMYKNAQARALEELHYAQFTYQYARSVMGLEAF